MNLQTAEPMKPTLTEHYYVRAQGIPFLIIAAILMTIAFILWWNGVALLIATAVLAFALFLVACAIQSFKKRNRMGRAEQNPVDLFSADKLPFILGLIPLGYAVTVGLILAPPKARIIIIFFVVFITLIISYLRDFFKPRKAEETDRMDKFYGKVAEAHETLGLRRGIGHEDIATRRISPGKKFALLGGMLRLAPWQLIAALLLAVGFMVFMDFSS